MSRRLTQPRGFVCPSNGVRPSGAVFSSLERRTLFTLPPFAVRIGYVVPANRTASPDTIAGLQAGVQTLQGFYREQMLRWGLGDKTFSFETDVDGVTPKVNVLPSVHTDDFLRDDAGANDALTQYTRINEDAVAAGATLFGSGEVWILVAEIHQQAASGKVVGGPFLGLGSGDGSEGGVAHVSEAVAPFFTEAGLQDDRLLDGLVVPSIGPAPLVNGTSFETFEGSTIGAVASSHLGGLAHELGHAFGLPHDFRNDANANGNVMGNGERGLRGTLFPNKYADQQTWFSYADALELANSRYLNTATTYTDNTRPTLTSSLGTNVSPTNGKLRFTFNTSDASGLAFAYLNRNSETVAEMLLTGTSFSGFIETPYLQTGTATYELVVYDTKGNKSVITKNLTDAGGSMRAPRPMLRVSNITPRLGTSVMLDASLTIDPDSSAAVLTYEWDLDGDGTWDTAPASSPLLTTSFPIAGIRRVLVRVSDNHNNRAISSPIPIRVAPAAVAPAGLSLASFSDTGISNSDRITQAGPSNPLSFSGTAAAFAKVRLIDGTQTLGTTTADALGAWTIVVTATLAEGAHAISAIGNDGFGEGPASAALEVTVDNVAPIELTKLFDVNARQTARWTFGEAVFGTLLDANLSVVGPAGALEPLDFIGGANGTEVTIVPIALLANGNYTFTFLNGPGGRITDAAGNAVSGTLSSFVLAGDADRDRDVDFDDLLELARHYASASHTFTQGNFDYSADGVVSFDDLLILARNYNAHVPEALPAATSVTTKRPRLRATAIAI